VPPEPPEPDGLCVPVEVSEGALDPPEPAPADAVSEAESSEEEPEPPQAVSTAASPAPPAAATTPRRVRNSGERGDSAMVHSCSADGAGRRGYAARHALSRVPSHTAAGGEVFNEARRNPNWCLSSPSTATGSLGAWVACESGSTWW